MRCLILAIGIFSHAGALKSVPSDQPLSSRYNDYEQYVQQQITFGSEDSLALLLDEPMLELKHNAKTGGTFAKAVLDILLGGKINKNIPEFTPSSGIGYTNQTSAFKIGMIRDPCSLYTSLWAFCVLGKRGHPPYGGKICEVAPDQARIDDLGLFRRFVRSLVSDDRKIGLVTCRTHYNYVPRTKGAQGRSCFRYPELQTIDGEAVLRGFALSNATASADCWLHTETLEQDLRTCLELFERRTGQNAHLDKFDETVAFVHERHDNSASEHLEHDGFEGESMQPCSVMYDRKTRRFVEKHDRAVFEAFGYPGCCQSIH